jgi:ATP-dependent Clp protease ATP-binding subunit ClpA
VTLLSCILEGLRANELLFGELTQGGTAKVGVRKGKIIINVENKKELVEH